MNVGMIFARPCPVCRKRHMTADRSGKAVCPTCIAAAAEKAKSAKPEGLPKTEAVVTESGGKKGKITVSEEPKNGG